MGLLKNFFVEEIKEENEFIPDDIYLEEEVDVNTESVSQDNLIEDIYNQNELSDLSKSIFSSFGLTLDEVIEDGENRKTIINAALSSIASDNESVITENNVNIEQKKREIQELEKDNSDRMTIIKNTEDKIEVELKRISDLITFIGGEK